MPVRVTNAQGEADPGGRMHLNLMQKTREIQILPQDFQRRGAFVAGIRGSTNLTTQSLVVGVDPDSLLILFNRSSE
jgi:hypothetical protein